MVNQNMVNPKAFGKLPRRKQTTSTNLKSPWLLPLQHCTAQYFAQIKDHGWSQIKDMQQHHATTHNCAARFYMYLWPFPI